VVDADTAIDGTKLVLGSGPEAMPIFVNRKKR